MNTSKMLLALVGMGTAALVGCASESADETAGGADAVSAPSTLKATITTKTLTTGQLLQDIEAPPGCHVNLDRPVVQVPGKADVTRKITEALAVPASTDAVCSEYWDSSDPEQVATVDGGYTVNANATGLLSVSIFESSYATGAAHPNHSEGRFTFDLRNGKQLSLGDILETAAIRRISADCLEYGASWAETDAEKLQVCGRLFVVEHEGIRTYSNGDPRWDPEGTLHPWAEIRSDLKKGVVKDFAANPPPSLQAEVNCELRDNADDCSASSACEWVVRPAQGEDIGSVCVPK